MIDDQQLKQELREAGASKREVSQLLPIAVRLSTLKSTRATEREQVHWLGVLRPAAYAAFGLAIGIFLIIAAQAAAPTSWLYPVQKLSDNAAVGMHPEYRATVMMKRARQVNQLVASRAGANEVLAILADYTRVAGAYRSMPHTNYAAFEYCESNLKQASANASPQVQKAIATSLSSLESS